MVRLANCLKITAQAIKTSERRTRADTGTIWSSRNFQADSFEYRIPPNLSLV